jgi:acyl dehydratase
MNDRMMIPEFRQRGKTFDDLNVGDTVTTIGRTVTETDIVNFAGVSGDFHPEHMNEEYARNGPLKGRIAHGLLTTAMATGMINQTGITEGTTIAVLEMDLKFLGAVRAGDTIRACLKIREKRETSKPDRGIVFTGLVVVNQNNETVLDGSITIMLYRKGYPEAARIH